MISIHRLVVLFLKHGNSDKLKQYFSWASGGMSRNIYLNIELKNYFEIFMLCISERENNNNINNIKSKKITNKQMALFTSMSLTAGYVFVIILFVLLDWLHAPFL